MSREELIIGLREQEIFHRKSNLDYANFIRQLADSFERNKEEIPLTCEIPVREQPTYGL